jgi:hypothetical protein
MAVIAAIIRLASLTPAAKAAAPVESCSVETNALS